MRIGIMQPYLFPYIGYWQLLAAVDRYVVYDDVNYIKGGWINRNRILFAGEPKYFNVQMRGASPNKRINEVALTNNAVAARKQLCTIELAYQRAPEFQACFPLVRDCLGYEGKNLAEFVTHSIRRVMDYLDIRTEIMLSSELDKDDSLRGQEKVLQICGLLGAREYWNAIGGQALYDRERFRANGIDLFFLQSDEIRYQQFDPTGFVPNLSIIDVMMFNPPERIRAMLQQYSLL